MEEMTIYKNNTVGIRLFRTETCPKCEKLKTFLNARGLEYTVIDMQSTEGLTELRFNGVFALEAPVLQINDNFYTPKQLFTKNEISEQIQIELIKYEIDSGTNKFYDGNSPQGLI